MTNCCPSEIPPVVTGDYTPSGIYETHHGHKTYVTGTRDAKSAVVIVYDIFGFFPQTIQGADIIAAQLDALVVMPDFFHGEGADISAFPPDTEEKKSKLAQFFQTKADLTKNVTTVNEIVGELKQTFPSAKRWAVVGFCWGGKITTLSSTKDTPFVASVQVHPAFLDPTDAEKITIPHLCLPSKDEPADAVEAFKSAIETHQTAAVKEKSEVTTYPDMYHGWMAARAKLQEEKYRKGYEKGYAHVSQWLKSIL